MGSVAPSEQKAKHTPGPWHYDSGFSFSNHFSAGPSIASEDANGKRWIVAICTPIRIVYMINRDGFSVEDVMPEAHANAFLIAAAPELLAALKVARRNIQFLPPDGVMEQIEAAIAKAEGH